MNIYDAIRNDHEKIKKLFQELLSLSDDDGAHFELVQQIRDEFIPHARAEEALLYNSIRALAADRVKDVHHYFQEHLTAEMMLVTLQAKEKVNLNWKKTARKLKESLEAHMLEEETEVFIVARRVLSDEESEKIGVAFEKMKPEIRKEGLITTTFEMVKNLLPARINKVMDIANRGSIH